MIISGTPSYVPVIPTRKMLKPLHRCALPYPRGSHAHPVTGALPPVVTVFEAHVSTFGAFVYLDTWADLIRLCSMRERGKKGERKQKKEKDKNSLLFKCSAVTHLLELNRLVEPLWLSKDVSEMTLPLK